MYDSNKIEAALTQYKTERNPLSKSMMSLSSNFYNPIQKILAAFEVAKFISSQEAWETFAYTVIQLSRTLDQFDKVENLILTELNIRRDEFVRRYTAAQILNNRSPTISPNTSSLSIDSDSDDSYGDFETRIDSPPPRREMSR